MKLLAPLLEVGKDIVLVMHSYGGPPGSVAARGQSKTERKSRGLKGGVIGLVFIAALLAPEGASLRDMVGGKFHPWVHFFYSVPAGIRAMEQDQKPKVTKGEG